MQRRQLFKQLLAVPLLAVPSLPAKKYGKVDMKRHRELRAQGTVLRSFLNGRYIADICFEADDIKGYALVYKLNEKGSPYLDKETGCLPFDVLTGQVEFRNA